MTSRLALITFLDVDPGARPDNTLPGGQGGHPAHPIYNPAYPDNTLPGVPGAPVYPSHPIHLPPYPSQGLPPFPSHPIVIPPPGGGQPPYPDHTLPGAGSTPGFPVNLPAQNPEGGWVYAFVPGVGWVWAYKPSDARPDNALPGAQPGIDNTLPTPPVDPNAPVPTPHG